MAYTTLEIFSAIYLLIIIYVGIKIFSRYRKSGYMPSLILAGSFFLFALTAIIVGTTAGLSERIPEFREGRTYEITRLVCMNTFYFGVLLISVFTWRVFRPGRRWSMLLIFGIGILLFISKDLLLSLEPTSVWLPWQSRPGITLIYSISQVIAFGWLIMESLSHWRKYKGQLQDGAKLDPLVVNRFLIWGLAGMAYLVSSICTLQVVSFFHPRPETLEPFFLMEGPTLQGKQLPMIVNLVIYIKGSAVVFFSVCSLLCWAPPESYKRFISGRTQG